MLGEDGAAVGIDLAERDGSHPGPFEAEAEAADAGKKIEDIHFSPKTGVDMSGPMALYTNHRKGNGAR